MAVLIAGTAFLRGPSVAAGWRFLVNFLLPPPMLLTFLLVLPFPRQVRKGLLIFTNQVLSFTVCKSQQSPLHCCCQPACFHAAGCCIGPLSVTGPGRVVLLMHSLLHLFKCVLQWEASSLCTLPWCCLACPSLVSEPADLRHHTSLHYLYSYSHGIIMAA